MFKLGKAYKVTWLDHYSEDNETSKDATLHEDCILTTYGICVGITPKYVILAYIFENNLSHNNDNMHIMKCAILKVKKLS